MGGIGGLYRRDAPSSTLHLTKQIMLIIDYKNLIIINQTVLSSVMPCKKENWNQNKHGRAFHLQKRWLTSFLVVPTTDGKTKKEIQSPAPKTLNKRLAVRYNHLSLVFGKAKRKQFPYSPFTNKLVQKKVECFCNFLAGTPRRKQGKLIRTRNLFHPLNCALVSAATECVFLLNKYFWNSLLKARFIKP